MKEKVVEIMLAYHQAIVRVSKIVALLLACRLSLARAEHPSLGSRLSDGISRETIVCFFQEFYLAHTTQNLYNIYIYIHAPL